MRKASLPLILIVVAGIPFYASSASPEHYAGFSNAGPTGPAVDGFALALTSDAQPFYLGRPMIVTVELRNVSGRYQAGIFGSVNSAAYAFRIVNRITGNVVSANPDSPYGLTAGSKPKDGWPIPEGTSVYGRFRLDLLYKFQWPGVYSVQVIKGQPIAYNRRLNLRSNAITITIFP